MGPKIVPCGTPALMIVSLDFTPPIFTRCLRWHRKDVSHLVIKVGNPSDAHLVSKIWWSTLSNALLKSTSSTRIMVPLESSTYHIYIHTYTHIRVNKNTHKQAHTQMHTHIHARAHPQTHNIHTRTHARTHARTHTVRIEAVFMSSNRSAESPQVNRRLLARQCTPTRVRFLRDTRATAPVTI